MGVSKNGWFIVVPNPIKMNDLGCKNPLFLVQHPLRVFFSTVFWLARLVGNEGPSTFTTLGFIGDETEPSFPTGRAS